MADQQGAAIVEFVLQELRRRGWRFEPPQREVSD
jgi:hypothetical protein